jgi:hypothetical protein
MHMHGDSYSNQQILRKRERGRRMANARWAADRRRRDELARTEPLVQVQSGRRLIMRIVVITADQRAVELCRWSDTSARAWASLKRSAGI